MPCESGPSYEQIREDRELRDAQTRLACERVEWLRANKKPIPAWAKRWVAIHDREDEERREEEERQQEIEQNRKTALSKLTKKERDALGV